MIRKRQKGLNTRVRGQVITFSWASGEMDSGTKTRNKRQENTTPPADSHRLRLVGTIPATRGPTVRDSEMAAKLRANIADLFLGLMRSETTADARVNIKPSPWRACKQTIIVIN